jgi:hypothetical protein
MMCRRWGIAVILLKEVGSEYGTGYVAFLLIEDRAVGDQIHVLRYMLSEALFVLLCL